MSSEDYLSPDFRNRCIQQIGELLRALPNATNKSAADLEMQIFNRSKKKDDYVMCFSRVLTHMKEQVSSSTQNNPHLAAMLIGQAAPNLASMHGGQQMGQMNGGPSSGQQMGQQQMPGGPQRRQIGQANQMGQVGQMGNAMRQGNPQMSGQGQMVGHGGQGMGAMNGMGQAMGMGGVSVSHGQQSIGSLGGGTGGVQPNQMVPNGGPGSQMGGMGCMGPGNSVMNQMTMVGQGVSTMSMAGGQVMSSANMMAGHGQGMVSARMTSAMGMAGGQGAADMPWQGANNSHIGMGVLKSGVGAMTGSLGGAKMGGPIQMSIAGQSVGSHMSVSLGRGGVPVAEGTSNMKQQRIPSPNYSSAPTGLGITRQSIPCTSVSVASPGTSQVNSQTTLMACQNSPASFIAPSPSSSMVPSPASSTCGRGNVMSEQPSPGSIMVNTPGQPLQQQPSPASVPPPTISQMEEKAYLEKIKQLQKFVEPLRKLIAKPGDEEGKMTEVAKMKKLLDLLQNPLTRMPMNPMKTLECCEKVLEKLEIHKESAMEVLMEGVRAALKAPNSSSIFHRTLSPAVTKLTGCSIAMPPAPKKRKMEDPPKDTSNLSSGSSTTTAKISYVIEGEVARLPSRFKINLDSQQPAESDDVTLNCNLDDSNLPCVPPLFLTIPKTYPDLPPGAKLPQSEYTSTEFLRRVQDVFLRRQKHLPLYTSITQLLDTWEMSIRQACSPNAAKNPNAVSPFAAIMELMIEA